MKIGAVETHVPQNQEVKVQKVMTKEAEKQDISDVETLQVEEEGEQELFKAVEKMKEAGAGKISYGKKDLEYAFHEETNTVLIKIVDSETEEIIKEIPSEEMQDMVAAIRENAGLFVNRQI